MSIDKKISALTAATSLTGGELSGIQGGDNKRFPATLFATAAQGALAATATQPGDLATVATTGAYSDLTGAPTLGTAAASDTGDFATAAQGTLADSALQSSDIGTSVQAHAAVLDATTASFTTTLETKLSGIAAGAEVNTVDSVNALTGAVVLDPDDLDDTATTNKFTTAGDISKLAGIEAGATADQTGAEIKAAYEAEANTNAYTDAEKSKLSGIEALADITDATNVEAAGAVMDADIGVTVQAYDANLANVREALTANRTYYVDGTSGSDSNDGLSSGAGAFATIQKAIDTVSSLDAIIYDVTISVASGTYTAALTLKNFVGTGKCTVTCPSGTATVSVTSDNAIYAQNLVSRWYLGSGMKVSTTTSGSCIYIEKSSLYLTGLEFGACASVHIVLDSSFCYSRASYTISGSAAYHVLATTGSQMLFLSPQTVTLSGTPAFSTAFISVLNVSTARVVGVTFSGSATGARYLAKANSVIDTGGGGATYLPGDSAGSTATGGQYV